MFVFLCIHHCADAALTEIIKEYGQVRAEGGMREPAIRDAWVANIEKEIAVADRGDPNLPLACFFLAELYVGTGDMAPAVATCERIAKLPQCDAHLRLQSEKLAADASLKGGLGAKTTLAHVDAYLQVFQANANNPTIANAQERLWAFQADRVRAEAYKADGMLEEANTYRLRYLERLSAASPEVAEFGPDLDRMSWGLERTLRDAAGFYTSQDDPDVVAKALPLLNTYFSKFASNPYAHNAAVMLLSATARLHPDQLLSTCSRIGELLPPGHGFVTEVRRLAEGLSFDDPPNYLLADGLLHIAKQKEAAWFANEFKEHVNYQWTVLLLARNAIEAENLAEAVALMQELRELPISDEGTAEFYGAVRKEFESMQSKLPGLTDIASSASPQNAAPVAATVVKKNDSQPGSQPNVPRKANRAFHLSRRNSVWLGALLFATLGVVIVYRLHRAKSKV